ncbi:uncharacterized protein LOC121415664 [Lytechinus variegatus]|uniref:uncharacterized protein LOC121415664 n=1 Tax=Lytechinus variegatus TaxID=7654 RepID=UPI001BB1F24B|nr:uncharacterized protein LOC121415664 [Lytechinus variegatus]XP_041464900.1 uncharacterized protein LOC121415664 [Lytechinus variegatus]
MEMDVVRVSGEDSVSGCESRGKSDRMFPETSSCTCTYDFAILHGEKDKGLAERFFAVLEGTYKLKGYLSKRDCVVGVIKQRQLVRAWQASSFIIELISPSSFKNKVFQKYRSIAHEVESKRTKPNHPEVLPIYVDIPLKEQRGVSTRVGRSYSDTDLFWDELAAHILNNHSCVEVTKEASVESRVDSNQNDPSSNAHLDLTNNNNDPAEKPLPVKCRKKHKIFRGLFKNNKKKKFKRKLKTSSDYKKKAKGGKRKSRKNLKSLRKLLVCVPAGSKECSCSSPPTSIQPVSTFHSPNTAKVEEVELNFAETASRMDTTSEHER